MAILVSPGVLTQEIDLSLYVPALTTTTLGLVGTCTQGATDTPQLITSPTQLAQIYGNTNPNHPMIQTALWFLEFASSLWVVRVANQSLLASASALLGVLGTSGQDLGTNTGPFTFAPPTFGVATGSVAGPYDITSSNNTLSIATNGGSDQTITLTQGATQTALQVAANINSTLTGAIATVNSSGFIVITSTGPAGTSSNVTIAVPGSDSANSLLGLTPGSNAGTAGAVGLSIKIDAGSTQALTLPSGLQAANQVAAAINAVITGATASVVNGAIAITSNTVGSGSSVQGVTSPALTVLGLSTTLNSGSAAGGTSETITALTPGTWGNGLTVTVTPSNNVMYPGTVNLTVQLNGYTVEVWKYLSKNTTSPYYWPTVINGNSSYITVTDNTGVSTQPGPIANVLLAGGNDGLVGITDADFIGVQGDGYNTGLQNFADPGSIDINLVAIPGQTDQSIHSALIALVEGRGDCMCFLDPPSGLNPQQVVQFKTATGSYTSRAPLNDNRSAMYYPWVNAYDPTTGVTVLLPPSAAAIRACAYNDSVGNVWNEFLGVNRGLIPEATGIERTLNQGSRDFVYENNINPIANLPQYGIVIWGGKTLQTAPTALDRVNTRRMLDYLHKVVVTALYPLIGEPNTPALWRRLTALLQPTLDYLVSQQGVSQYQIICDASNNPQSSVNAHQVNASIGILPVPGAEFIYVNFVLVNNLATFTDYIANQGT